MKITPILLSLLICLFTRVEAWDIAGIGQFQFDPVTASVHVMHGPNEEPSAANQGFMNNPAIIESANGVILIDPGSSYHVGKQVLAEIRKVTDKPVVAVFNTHIHGDHWLGNHAFDEAFPDATIYAHPTMKAQAPYEGPNWINIMSRLTEGISANTKLVIPGETLDNSDTVNIDGQKFRIHAVVPAHTKTDIMIEHINSSTVFLGDNCFRDRFGQFDGNSSISSNILALQKMLDLNAAHYVPGHGQSGTAGDVVEPYLNYLRLLQAVVSKGYEEDLQAYEIKQANISRFDEYRNWNGFSANLGKHIGKMYLEIEEKAW